MIKLIYLYVVVEKPEHSVIKVEDFTEHVALLKAEKDAKLNEEFELLDVHAPFTQHAAKLLCNKPKNRYRNIIPCEFDLHSGRMLKLILLQTIIQGWC